MLFMVTIINDLSDIEKIIGYGPRTNIEVEAVRKVLPPNYTSDEDGNFWATFSEGLYVFTLYKLLNSAKIDPFRQTVWFDVRRKKTIQKEIVGPLRICGATYDEQNVVYDVELQGDYLYNEMHKN
jgi:hypothetical protein